MGNFTAFFLAVAICVVAIINLIKIVRENRQ